MINFCTLFDSNYIDYGLALYNSLEKYCKDFHLYIFAFDDKSKKTLRELSLDNVTIISLKEFEDEDLLNIKQSRTKGEYCWTCTSSVILYALKKFSLESCTYLDADLYFFSDPKALIDEIPLDKSILLTEHRYYPKKDNQLESSGKYCVQFMFFRNDKAGLEALNWWRDECIKWCYNRVENGKFGDQKYLDDWLKRFKGVYELKHLGGGVAPWNIEKYNIFCDGDKIQGLDIETKESFSLVFYHFHDFKFLENNKIKLTGDYIISNDVKNIIYRPYIQEFRKSKGFIFKESFLLTIIARSIGIYKKYFKSRTKYNIISQHEINL